MPGFNFVCSWKEHYFFPGPKKEKKKVVQMNPFTKQIQRHRLSKQIYGSQGEKKGGINWEIGIDIQIYKMDFPGGSLAKNQPANAGDMVRSLGGEDALEKEMATHSSILAWRIPWTEEPGRLQSKVSQKVGHN